MDETFPVSYASSESGIASKMFVTVNARNES